MALEAGTLTLLLGVNGAGKSSLLRCLSGAAKADAGRITLHGEDISRMKPFERTRKIGYLPQAFQSPFAFTASELLRIGAGKDVPPTHPAVEALEIGALLPRALSALSGGERQRAAVCRALVGDASVLLLDEPTAHLDPRYALRLLRYLQSRASAGQTICMASHDLALTLPFASHISLLDRGRIAFHGPVRDLPLHALRTGLQLGEEIQRDEDGRLHLTIS